MAIWPRTTEVSPRLELIFFRFTLTHSYLKGWQWCASVSTSSDGDFDTDLNLPPIFVSQTGTDPQPYFRIFNPTSQSEKASPDGAYIRYWVPELKNLKGKGEWFNSTYLIACLIIVTFSYAHCHFPAIHDPHGSLSPKEFEKLGYPKPIVDHAKARQRALFRYKNPGEKEE